VQRTQLGLVNKLLLTMEILCSTADFPLS
jgi:hypothetical protein